MATTQEGREKVVFDVVVAPGEETAVRSSRRRPTGSYDIQSIVKITPMPQLDALLVFWKLHEGGFIKVETKRK